MYSWIETKIRVQALKNERLYNKWRKKKVGLITFFIYPEMKIESEWFKKRSDIYRKNAKKLGVKPPKINFFVYPSMEEGEKIGIMPAVAFPENKEIHGHLRQSPGHEVTHILLRQIKPSKYLKVNRFWNEGTCTYLNGTNIDHKERVLSLNIKKEILNTPWENWYKKLPSDLYHMAASVIQFLEEQYDWKATLSYLRKLRNSPKNDNAFSKKIFNASMKDLQNNWLRWLNKKRG